MKKKVVCLALTSALAATCCAAIFTACDNNEDDDGGTKNVGFDKTTVFHVDLTMSTAIGPLSTLCNPGTITFEPNGDAKMNLTFTESAIVMMDNLLGFRISNFVHNDTYELSDDQASMVYHSSRKYSDRDELVFGDLQIPIEYLSDNSMKFTFDIGKAIPDTVLYFYSNEAMMPKPEEPEPEPKPEEPETFTLSYDLGGGVLAEGATLPEATEFEEETEITLPEADFAKEGYLFRGWAIYGIEGLGLWQPGDKYTVKSDVKFVAVWDETATFTFTDGNGLSQTFEAKIGETICLPECMFASNDVKKGFGYWLQEGSSVKKYPGDTISVKTDTVFTADFTDLINLTFSAGEGTGETYIVTIPAYSKFIIPECAYQTPSEDKGFGGWKAGYSTYKPGAKNTRFDEDTELVAQWKNYVTISFNANGGTGDVPENFSSVNGMDFVLPESALTAPENTRFGGWSTAKGKTTGLRQPGDTASQTKNTTYYALWDMMRTVSFDTGIEGKTVESVTQYERDKITLPEMPYENGNKRFAGWGKKATDTSGTAGAAGKNYTVPAGSDTTLYAIWDDYVAVSFAGGEGATGTTEAIGAYERDKVVLPECTFEKEGYVFDCWTDGKRDYAVGKEYTVPQDGATLTAKWVAKVTVTFAGGEGATGATDGVFGGATKTIVLPENNFVKDGYLFGGWKDAEGNVYQAGAEYTLPASETATSITLTAVWNQGTPYADYTATFRAGLTSENVCTVEDKTLTLNDFMNVGGSMAELILRSNLSADFVIKATIDEAAFKKLGSGLSYTEFKDSFNIEYKNIPYTYDKEANTVTLKPLGQDEIVLQLRKVAKNDKIGYDNVQFEYALKHKFGAVEKLLFAAFDGAPKYLSETKVFKGAIPQDAPSFGGTAVELTVNADGSGKLKASILGLPFFHMFSPDMKTIIWLGDQGDRLEGTVGQTEDGKMTLSITFMGVTVTLTEVEA